MLTLEQFDGRIRRLAFPPEVKNGDDVRMREGGDSFGLTFEAGVCGRLAREFGGENLDGDGAIEPRVSGFVDFAHTAGAQRRNDLIGTESGSGGERHDGAAGLYRGISSRPTVRRPLPGVE